MTILPSHTPATLASLPLEILLDIIFHLYVEDLVPLLNTCQTLRPLADTKLPWILALQATRHVRPIPLPHRTDLTALDLSHLKRAAYHAIRLIQNWSSERPRLTEPIETVPFTDDTEIVCIVPGANIIMLFESPHLVLYDSNVRQRVVELPIGSNYWLVSRAYFEIYGKLLMTVAVGDHGPTNMVLIEVTYGLDTTAEARVKQSHILPAGFFDLFNYEDMVGYMWINDDHVHCFTAWNIETSKTVECATPFHSRGGTILTCYVDYGHLFLIYEDENSITVLRYHRNSFPYGSASPGRHHFTSSRIDLESVQNVGLSPGFSDSYGVVAVSVREPTVASVPDPVPTLPLVHVIHMHAADVDAPLVCAPPVILAAPVLHVASADESLTSVRATCAVYVLASQEDTKCQLQLVRYGPADDADRRHIIELGVDSGVVASELTGITSDDYTGVVYLISADGMLSILRFA